MSSCYCKPVSCPNGCNVEVIGNKLQQHLEKECIERIVNCPMHKYGCQAQIKYKDLNAHNSQNQLEHIQHQINWMMLENECKNQKISELECQISQLSAPKMLHVDGSYIASMNGIYKKEDEQREYKESFSMRPCYKHMDNEWTLYYEQSTREWMFDSKASIHHGNACCSDNALYPQNIKNQQWKVWMSTASKCISIDNITINEFDLLSRITSTELIQLLNTGNIPKHAQPMTNGKQFSAPSGPLFHVDETKSATLNPAFVPNEVDRNNNSIRRHRRNSNVSLTSSSNESVSTAHNSVSPRLHTTCDNLDWSISASIKVKYDRLYDDLLRREANKNVSNPFGPPMVSNHALYAYLTSVGYQSKLIQTLWKLINAFNDNSNTNNLLTRNGFVAICHLLDKITNNGQTYRIPSTLPFALQPHSLNNLISTPVHNETLNNTVFPNIADAAFTDTESMQTNANEMNLNHLFGGALGGNDEREESKQDFLGFTPKQNEHNFADDDDVKQSEFVTDHLLTLSSPNMGSNDVHTLDSFDFLPRSKTKPNTPRNGVGNGDFLMFPVVNGMHSMQKSKSLDARESTNESLGFAMNGNVRNDLDDLWDQSWQSSMNHQNKTKNNRIL